MKPLRVAVVGGGPGGLMTAYRLQRKAPFPCEITLFEASDRLGGKIVTQVFDAHPVTHEAGAAELYDYSQLGPDPLRELIAELGLTTVPLGGKTVILNDELLTTEADVRRVLGDDTCRELRRFRRRARALISPGEYYESDWKADNDDPLARQTFEEFLAAVPDERARRYLRVAVHSDLATEPHRTSAMYGLQNYLMDEPDYMQLYTIEGGLERLPRALAERLAAHVRLNHRVARIERLPGSLYRVTTRHRGETRHEDFDFVVIALPGNWLSAIEWGGDRLAAAMHAHRLFYHYPAHYLRVSLLFQRPFWRDRLAESFFRLDAFGGCCVYDETSRNGDARHGDVRQEHIKHGVLGWLLAGEAALTLSNLDDAALCERVLDALPAGLGRARDEFLEGRVYRWVGTVNGLPGGFPAREPDSRHQPEPVEHPELFVVGDYLFDSTINGVLDSADTVVEWILEEMEEEPAAPVVNGSAQHTGQLSDTPDRLDERRHTQNDLVKA